MKKYASIVLMVVFIFGCKSKKDSTSEPPVDPPPGETSSELLLFKFNETFGQTIAETKTSASFTINGPSGSAERINGLDGKALRTNGYYGWASGKVNVTLPTSKVCITGWVAPAAFPVQRKDLDELSDNTNASIFTNVNPFSNSGAALGIDQWGRVIGQFKVGTEVVKIVSDQAVPLKKWSFISLNINSLLGTASLYLNATKIKTVSYAYGNLSWDKNATVFIGKESKSKTVAGFDTNGLTGAIDQVVLWNKDLTDTEIQNEFKKMTVSDPDLRIPTAIRYANDNHRPKYHLVPSASWSNETHGLMYVGGKYHIFSQRNFNGPYLEHINWGHFVSSDLVSWDEKTQVLWPQPGFDEVGIWSGHAVVKNGNPYIFYTGVNKARAAIGLATSNAPYDTWTKNTSPVIAGVPSNIPNADFRDPFVFQNNSNWYMMIGTGLRSGTARGGLFLYKSTSDDFKQWSQQGTMFEGNPSVDGSGEFWEMPVYYNFGAKSVLLVNKLPDANAIYWTGSFDGSKFNKDNDVPKKLEVINHLLSPSIAPDENGKLTAIGIIPDHVSSEKNRQQGWAHVFSLPRVWTLVNDKIVQVPHPNVLKLRGTSKNFTNVSFSPTTSNVLGGASGTQYEIVATIDPGTATKVGFTLLSNLSINEKTLVYYDTNTKNFVVDRSNSSTLSGVPKSIQSGSCDLPAGDIRLRVFVDASVIEVFINEEFAFATRSFPSEGSNQIDLYAQGGTAIAKDLKIYNIQGGGTASVAKFDDSKEDNIIHPLVYPNPSSSDFNFKFNNVQEDLLVTAYIFDIYGFPIKRIVKMINKDNDTVNWNGVMDNGVKVSEGVYLIKGFLGSENFDAKIIVN